MTRLSAAEYRALLAGPPPGGKTNKFGAKRAWRCRDCGACTTKEAKHCPACGSPYKRAFASRAEAKRYDVLRAMERTRSIHDLVCQPGYDLVVNGVRVGVYTADFAYRIGAPDGAVIVEDVKSKATMTEAAVLRIKLAEAVHGIKVTIVGR